MTVIGGSGLSPEKNREITKSDMKSLGILAGIIGVGISALIGIKYYIPESEREKPAERPRIEYRDVNKDKRNDVIMYLGGKEYIFLQNPNGNYVLSNLEKSVEEGK